MTGLRRVTRLLLASLFTAAHPTRPTTMYVSPSVFLDNDHLDIPNLSDGVRIVSTLLSDT